MRSCNRQAPIRFLSPVLNTGNCMSARQPSCWTALISLLREVLLPVLCPKTSSLNCCDAPGSMQQPPQNGAGTGGTRLPGTKERATWGERLAGHSTAGGRRGTAQRICRCTAGCRRQGPAPATSGGRRAHCPAGGRRSLPAPAAALGSCPAQAEISHDHGARLPLPPRQARQGAGGSRGPHLQALRRAGHVGQPHALRSGHRQQAGHPEGQGLGMRHPVGAGLRLGPSSGQHLHELQAELAGR